MNINKQIKVSKVNDRYQQYVIFDGSVYRWAANNRVPPQDAIKAYEIDKLPNFDASAHDKARDAETAAFLGEVIVFRAKNGYSAEERAEMRAAFGPGAELVDIVTGKRIKT